MDVDQVRSHIFTAVYRAVDAHRSEGGDPETVAVVRLDGFATNMEPGEVFDMPASEAGPTDYIAHWDPYYATTEEDVDDADIDAGIEYLVDAWETAQQDAVRGVAEPDGSEVWTETDVAPAPAAVSAMTWASLAAALKTSYAEQMATAEANETTTQPTACFNATYTQLTDDQSGPITAASVGDLEFAHELPIDLAGPWVSVNDTTNGRFWYFADDATYPLIEFGVTLDFNGCRSEEDDDDPDDHTSGWEPTYPHTQYLTAYPFITPTPTDEEG